jgi:hypothetical protein
MFEEMTGISRETICKILVRDLKKKKIYAHFVPHLLTLSQKHQCAASSVEFVEMIDDDRNILKRIVISNESLCFMYDPETKCQECNLVESKEIESSGSENAKLAGENNVDCIFLC